MVAKKPTSASTGVKSVSLGDVRAAEATVAVKTTASASKHRDGKVEVKGLDKNAKEIDRREKTASSKETDKRAKEIDKVDKTQNPAP